jgi:dynein light intermediate chain 1
MKLTILKKDRQTYQTPEPTSPGATTTGGENEKLASFFAGLLKRGGGSAANSPKGMS